MKDLRIVYLGTPDFAVLPLENIIKQGYNVVAVVSQEDKLGARKKISVPPVKTVALSNNIPCYQFKNIRKDGIEVLKSFEADLFITCAYGQILSQEILDIPKLGVFNIHASLLPKYRGAAPIQAAILAKDKLTGVTIMKTEYEVDSGDILIQKSIEIEENDNSETLFDKLSNLGAKAIIEGLEIIEKGDFTLKKQDHTKATFTKMIKKVDGEIDFDKTYDDFNAHIRAMTPWPSAYTYLNGKVFKIFDVKRISDSNEDPGYMYIDNKKLYVTIKGSLVEIMSLQEEGNKKKTSLEYVNGKQKMDKTKVG